MKKFFIIAAALLLLGFLTFSFAELNYAIMKGKREGTWQLEKIENVEIMSIPQTGITLSDAQKALFLKKIRYESLPVSAELFFENSCSLGKPEGITCKVVYKNIEIEQPIADLCVLHEDSLFKSSGVFAFKLSDLKTNGTEQEIVEFLKAFPSDKQIKYSIKPVYQSENKDTEDWINLYE
jgi:hypothetical protein